MKRMIGLTGGNGKLGSLLLKRANFVNLRCDVTDIESIKYNILHCGFDLDLIVNCAAMSGIEECELNQKKAFEVNVKGLYNLHKVFGSRVLNISTDQVFSGSQWAFLPVENSIPNPINWYGKTKWGAEIESKDDGGKTIRLSRTVSVNDRDIHDYIWELASVERISVPTFFKRNYLHKEFAVDGIEYFAKNYDDMPELVNYGGLNNVSMYDFIHDFADDLEKELVTKNKVYDEKMTPRPKKGGFNVSLAQSLGFPMYTISDTVSRLREENIDE